MVSKECAGCGAEVTVELPESGPFARFAERAAEHPLYCDECLERERAAEDRRQAARAAEDRVCSSGMPSRLQRVEIEQLEDVPTNAIAAAMEWGAGHRGGLVFTGPVGVGKTWLAAAAARRLAARRRIQWCSVASLMIQVTAAFGDEDRARAIRNLTGSGALVLDDLDKVNPSPWAKQHLYAAVDTRVAAGAPLLVTTNLDLRRVGSTLGEEIASRLEGYCRVVTLRGVDRRRHDYRRREAERRFSS